VPPQRPTSRLPQKGYRFGLRAKLALLMTLASASALIVTFLILYSLTRQQDQQTLKQLQSAISSTATTLQQQLPQLSTNTPTRDAIEHEMFSTVQTTLQAKDQRRQHELLILFLAVPLTGFFVSWLLSLRLETLIRKPIAQLAQTALQVTQHQDYSPRLQRHAKDEIGDLIDGFNTMLAEIQRREIDLQQAHDDLEQKVLERTQNLRQEINDRQLAQKELAQQLARTKLLDHITQAIASHQDIQSILNVAVTELTHSFSADFSAVLLSRDSNPTFRVEAASERDPETTFLHWQTEKWSIPPSACGWSLEQTPPTFTPDTANNPLPVFQQLNELGMHSGAALPLRHDGQLKGVLLVGQRSPNGFTPGEQEFLRSLSEHVALAGHQANLYAELQYAYDEIQQTQQTIMQHERLRALGQMASGVAHDINNALSPIGGFAEVVLATEQNLSDNSRKFLGIIKTSSDDIAQIVARLREFYRPRADLEPLLQIDVNRLIHQVVELTRPRWRDVAQRNGIHIETHLDLSPDNPSVLGIETELREALTNLIFNAVDALPQGGHLTLSSHIVRPTGLARPETAPSFTILEVRDSGTGMTEEVRQHCLDPFYSTKGKRGTGLGLAMVYGTVERHEGRIEIESQPGKGTTIRLILPSRQNPANQSSPSPEILSPNTKLRILYVDDEPLLRELVSEILETDGHEVLCADGGPEALKVFHACRDKGHPVDVVITDFGMPVMDGAELTNRIKAISPASPVIMMTGWGKMMRGEEEVPAPVDALVSKPPRMPEIQAALRKVTQPTNHPQ
jgi:signal transduction histidine kinase/CheY-like chemotaxis protein